MKCAALLQYRHEIWPTEGIHFRVHQVQIPAFDSVKNRLATDPRRDQRYRR